MAFVSLVFASAALNSRAGHTTIGALMLDALLSEGVKLNSKATQYPVELGSPISDHISREPERLTISGVVSSASVQLFGGQGRENMVRAKDALRGIHESQATVTIVTGIDMYRDMAMESCDINRAVDGLGGDALDISCQFVRIRKASLKTAVLPPMNVADGTKGKAGGVSNAGKAATVPAEPSTTDKAKQLLGLPTEGSILSNIL